MKLHTKIQNPVEVEITKDGLEVRKLHSKKRLTLPFSEADLLKDLTPRTAFADLIANSVIICE